MVHSLEERWHMVMMDLLDGVNRCQPDRLPQLVNAAVEQVSSGVTIYLVDYEQQILRPLTESAASSGPLPVDGGVAGRAYRLGQVEAEAVNDAGDVSRLWVPLLDGTERLGVLEILVTDELSNADPMRHEPYVSFANLVGHLIAGKLPYSDRLQRARRSKPMSVASELLRQLLPPSTFTSDRLVVSASLQPPYSVGGDAFDYAVDEDTAYVAIFDGQGHGLEAGLSTAVALAATRAARREGDGIYLMAQSADGHLSAHFSHGQFVTAILAQLDLNTGLFSFLNAGHPPPVLLHGDESPRNLDGGRRPPLGIAGTVVGLGEQYLAPGDRLLLYTDGITESRDRTGQFFGLDRLVGLAARHADRTLSPPETARRITQAVLDYCDGSPDDDATIMLLEWSTGAVERTLP